MSPPPRVVVSMSAGSGLLLLCSFPLFVLQCHVHVFEACSVLMWSCISGFVGINTNIVANLGFGFLEPNSRVDTLSAFHHISAKWQDCRIPYRTLKMGIRLSWIAYWLELLKASEQGSFILLTSASIRGIWLVDEAHYGASKPTFDRWGPEPADPRKTPDFSTSVCCKLITRNLAGTGYHVGMGYGAYTGSGLYDFMQFSQRHENVSHRISAARSRQSGRILGEGGVFLFSLSSCAGLISTTAQKTETLQ